jgi:hypothetical protein
MLKKPLLCVHYLEGRYAYYFVYILTSKKIKQKMKVGVDRKR